MGTSHSKGPKITDVECEEFSAISKFKIDEIKLLHQHFRKISKIKEDDGVIDFAEFLITLGVNDSLVARQLYRMFDTNNDDRINFREFVLSINILVESDQFALSKVLFRLLEVKGPGKGFGFEDLLSVCESAASQFQYVRFPNGFMRNWLSNDMQEFRKSCQLKLEEPGLRAATKESLQDLINRLQNLQTFTFDENSFFVYFKFSPVTAQWLQVDLRVLQFNARQLLK